MGIYKKDGYIDMDKIRSYGMPFNFVIGGRGTGKTYNALKTDIECGRKFIYMRRTSVQLDIISRPELNPINAVCKDTGIEVDIKPIAKQISGYYLNDDDLPCGYMIALSIVKNLRGFDASDVEELIFDEFIAERHEKPIKEEAKAFFNCYETINRNRELNGKSPLRALCLANSNEIVTPLLTELKLVTIVEKMRAREEEVYIMRERGIGLFVLNGSKVSEKKRETALYKLTENTDFSSMALDNNFYFDDNISKSTHNLKEYKPLFMIGELCVYIHKSTGRYYVTTHKTGTPKVYPLTALGLTQFRREERDFILNYIYYDVDFEKLSFERIFSSYLKNY